MPAIDKIIKQEIFTKSFEKIAVKIFLQIIKLFCPLAIPKIRKRFILEKGIFVNLTLYW